MRLIDADGIALALVERGQNDFKRFRLGEIIRYAPHEVQKIVDEDLPTVDAVHVIRCRDCKHRVKNSCDSVEFYECDHMGLGQTRVGVKDDFFCADGERRLE